MAAIRRGAEVEPEPFRLRSVERALDLLQMLVGQPGGATPKEISRALGLHLSTVYRLLKTLVAASYVDRCGDTGLFRLGPRIPQLHYAFLESMGSDTEALPLLQALQVMTGETIHLFRLRGNDAMLTASVLGSRPGFIPVGHLGISYPAYVTAAGRALLACLPAPALAACLARLVDDHRFPETVAEPEAMRAELDRIRADGYALDRGRLISCVATPVTRPDGAVTAAIAAVVPSSRFESEFAALIPAVVAVGQALSAVLDGDPAVVGPLSRTRPEPDPAAAAAAAAVAALLRAPGMDERGL